VTPAEEHAALTARLETARALNGDSEYLTALEQTFNAVLDVLIEELPEPYPCGIRGCLECWPRHPVVRVTRVAVGAS
jgi:hypothetical protein